MISDGQDQHAQLRMLILAITVYKCRKCSFCVTRLSYIPEVSRVHGRLFSYLQGHLDINLMRDDNNSNNIKFVGLLLAGKFCAGVFYLTILLFAKITLIINVSVIQHNLSALLGLEMSGSPMVSTSDFRS